MDNQFQNGLNWSKYQNSQLDVLINIEKSFESSLALSKSLNLSLAKVDYSLTAIARELVSDVEAYNRGLSDIEARFRDAGDSLNRAAHDAGDALSGASNKFTQTMLTVGTSMKELVNNIWDYFGGLRGIGDRVDQFSQTSNNLIQSSGMSGVVVREFRAELMDIVGDLNSVTGNLYSSIESYNQILSATRGITSDLEAVEEMARPLLLAQETLDIDIGNIADIFNRFYTRYSFSSMNMEDALNEIRGNTAGNSANAEATVENIKALEKWINVIAQDDNEKRESMLEEISHYTSWLESMGMDSAPYTGYLESIAYGDWGDNKELLNILNRRGISSSDAQSMITEGQWGELTEAIVYGMRDVISTVQDSKALGRALDNLGIDRATAMENWAVLDSKNFTSFEDFLSSVSQQTATMEALAEDKYVSAQDKTNHLLERIYEKIASIQEYLPFGLSDIALALVLAKGALPSPGTLLGKLSKGGNNIAGGAVSSTIGTTAIGALGAAGIGAGLGLGIHGGYGLFADDSADAISKTLSGVELAAGATGVGALTASMLGAGAAAGPIGWIALAVGGLALVGKSAYEASTKLGSVTAIENAYEDAAEKITSKAKLQENSLLDIKLGLSQYEKIISSGTATEEELLEANKLLEEKRASLIELGILSESDIEVARKSNIEGLTTLTEAYLKATNQWSDESTAMLNKYKQLDMTYASELQGNLEYILQSWNDGDHIKKGSNQLKAVESLFFDLYQSLETRVSGGESLDKDTNKIYKDMAKAFKDGSLSSKEANSIIDEGLWNTAFKNANFSPEELLKAVGVMSVSNQSGEIAYNYITKGLGQYYGAENTAYVADIVAKIKSKNGVTTAEEAVILLEELKSKGFTSALYPEIADAAEAWGLKGYAEGTNYIDRDQLTLVHEGEAIIPKKYNPAANLQELRAERESIERSSQETRAYFVEFIEELQAIKEFLVEWKGSNEQREKISSAKSKYELNRAFVSRYMNV